MGCTVSYKDATSTLSPRQLDVPVGSYISLAWPSEERLYLLYAPSSKTNFHDFRIVQYDLHLSETKSINIPRQKQCDTQGGYVLQRMPNRNVAFLSNCVTLAHIITTTTSIYQLDINTNEQSLIRIYPQNELARDYSFAPDSIRYVQELGPSSIGGSKLFVLGPNGSEIQIITGFARLGSPSWSPDGMTIAFSGNETIPVNHLSLYPGIIPVPPSTVFEPYNLYLSSPEGKNVHEILSGVYNAGGLNWSPRGRRLAFFGRYAGVSGIWIFDTQEQQLARVWPESAYFDWSPDGKQFAIVDVHTQGDEEYGYLKVLDLPPQYILP